MRLESPASPPALSRKREGWGEGGCAPAKILFLMRSSKRLNRKSQLTTAEAQSTQSTQRFAENTNILN